ncbi:uncharacterized protein N7511_006453 [Penicillium nucicola]|uniref:uncharacterized protein n=1 Tax=Penicillium nucicola TaxID=1850975 RepID=UPI002545BA96|nr:uncharacterized protein N7511_006453 [Penicillium nucicola]KAJ5757759.1 hypothetical protein N7511_006453 [Penicillium nucicola]
MADDSFYLYGVGEKPDALTLGSLILEKYWQPLIARHYTHEMLSLIENVSDEALHHHTHSTEITNVKFHGTSRLSPGIGVDAGDIVNLNLAWKRELERIVIAEKGTRVILKDPEAFLTEQVLSNIQAQQKLKLWLSAASSAYVLNFKFARRPKVWLMTGMYVLEGARTIVSKDRSSKISAGISSALVGALSGVPVGGSVKLGEGTSWEMAMEVAEPHVWAAQFRLLDARFLKMGAGGVDGVKLPVSMGLYRDVMSVHTARGGEGRTVEVGLGPEGELEGDGDEDLENDQDSLEMEEYEKRLEQAIGVFEKAPAHFLQ